MVEHGHNRRSFVGSRRINLSLGATAKRLVYLFGTLLSVCAFLPATALAHGDDGDFSGRMVDKPDSFDVGKASYRFLPGRSEYEVRRSGRRPGYVHLDAGENEEGPPNNEGEGGAAVPLPTYELAPVCRTAYQTRIVVVYTHRPTDSTPTPTAALRSIVKRMNWKISDQSSQSSGGKRVVKMAVDCNASNEINVYNVATPNNNFAALSVAVSSALFGEPVGAEAIKYLIFDHSEDQESTSVVGVGGPVVGDESKDHDNSNIVYSSWALIYNASGVWENHTTIHELLHALGATQYNAFGHAPFATPGHHCEDGLDVLCYYDGTGGYFRDYCPEYEGYFAPTTVPIDCNKDTYFNAAPEEGTWLANHLDLAGPEDSFLVTPPRAATLSATGVKGKRATLRGEATPEGTMASYQIQYGLTSKTYYESATPWEEIGYGKSFSLDGTYMAEAPIENLSLGTKYKFRIAVKTIDSTVYGEEKTFTTTTPPPPTVTTQAATSVGDTKATLNGTVNPNGLSTSYEFEYGKTTSYGKFAPFYGTFAGEGNSTIELHDPASYAMEPNSTYHYRLVAENEGGTSYSEDKTFKTPRVISAPTYSSAFGSKGAGNGQLSEAQGMAVDPSGNVWVADTGNNRVQKFNSKGEYQCQIGAKGSGNGQFSSPHGIAADSKGNVWVADTANNRIEEISSECKYVAQVGKAGSGNGQLSGPLDVAVDPSGNLWVADSGNARIEKFDSVGGFLAKCGAKGTANGQFEKAPLSIGTDADGNVWAGDEAGRMEKFTPRCAFLAKFDQTGSGSSAKVKPVDFAIDPAGNIWVPSAEAHTVQGFNPEGEYTTSFGKEGTGAGQFSTPAAIAAGSDGALWVIDNSATQSRVEKWVPGTPYAVQTGQATGVKRTEAALIGKINPQGKATSYRFDYGTSETFGSSIPATAKSIGSGSEVVAVSQSPNGLKAGTTYYYHLVAITESGTTYGETRHFTTLPAPGPNAKWRIGGKTFAELGLAEVPIGIEGTTKIEISISGNKVVFECADYGSGTLTASGLSKETPHHECTLVGYPPSCKVSPIWYTVNGAYEPETGAIHIITPGCFYEDTPISGVSGTFGYGTEAVALGTNTVATGKFGGNPVTITSASRWYLTGEQVGKTLGFEEGPPEVFSQEASDTRSTRATLNGTVNPLGADSGYRFEYGTTTSYGTTTTGGEAGSGTAALSKSEVIEGLKPETTYHFRIVASSNGGTSYGKDKTFTTPALPNPNWRIEGSSLTELESGQPYESHGTFTVEGGKALGGTTVTIKCTEAGSGTLGYQETMNLSACKTELNGKESANCAGKSATPIKLDKEFHSENSKLTVIETSESCALGKNLSILSGSGLTMKAGGEAVEFPASLGEDTYILSATEEHKSHATISSAWKLMGKYAGKKLGYAEPAALNPNWHIKGSTLAKLEAWEPYESHGTFTVEGGKVLGGTTVTIKCTETGSGTLGYQETMNLTACKTEFNGKESAACAGNGTPIKLDGAFHSENSNLTTIETSEACSIGKKISILAGSGLTMKAGGEAVEFPASLGEDTYILSATEEHKSHATISSAWKLTGKYGGSGFGYE
jgi:sugar lactone lactonase YvrE